MAPWSIRHVDLSSPDAEIARDTRPVFAVFWWRSLPLGTGTYLPEQLPLNRGQLLPLASELASAQLAARLPRFGGPARATRDGRPVMNVPLNAARSSGNLLVELERLAGDASADARQLAVIICTRDRPQALAQCLARLTAQVSLPGEIVVVDNSIARTAEAAVSRFAGIRYLHEPRRGLSAARNAGIRASWLPLIAFTDDDVEPRPDWASEVVHAFSSPRVEAVTGLVLPARLDTPAQSFFQLQMGGLGGGCLPLIFDSRFFAETQALGAQVWRIGAGANMAFRRSAFDRIGLFDERLGAGASGCSEDSELWYRLLATGGTCRFEPRACVFHHHREQWSQLRSQMRAYMRGHVSALFVQAALFKHPGNRRRIFLQLPNYFVRTAFRAIRDGGGAARLQILWDEIAGWLCGLHYALRPGWRARSAPVLSAAVASAAAEAQWR
ncbi:MAG: glycosyltransferase [Dongiaceae bacterium]